MKKISLYVIVDTIFKLGLLFTLNLIWCIYFLRTVWLCILVSLVSSVLTIFFANLISAKKTERKKPKLEEDTFIENIKNTFVYMSNAQIVDFFFNLAKSKHRAIKHSKYVEVKDIKNIIIYPNFKMANLTCDDVIEIYNKCKKENVKKIIILCNKYDSNITAILDNFECKTIVLDYIQTYKMLLKPYEFYPKIKTFKNPKIKNTLAQLKTVAFNKKKTRAYVLSAFFMLFASIFVSYKIYYLIVASTLIVFAILCQFNFSSSKQSNEELLG